MQTREKQNKSAAREAGQKARQQDGRGPARSHSQCPYSQPDDIIAWTLGYSDECDRIDSEEVA